MGGFLSGWMDNRWMFGCWMDGGWMADGWIDRWMMVVGWMDGCVDGWMEELAIIMINKCNTQTYNFMCLFHL